MLSEEEFLMLVQAEQSPIVEWALLDDERGRVACGLVSKKLARWVDDPDGAYLAVTLSGVERVGEMGF